MHIPGTSENTHSTASGELLYELPDVIADHSVLSCIGAGSYGKVFLARNLLTGVHRALKVVFRDAFREARPYHREFEAICRFEPISRSHPGFVQILQVGKLKNAFYYIMELADDVHENTAPTVGAYKACTLGLNRGQILPIEKCIEIGSSLADCLSVLHENKLIHRDIKPSNIIFVNSRPKLADIGLVVQIDEANSMVGTAGFMPPEGPVSPASDIYSLGKVLYEIATGKDRCEFPELPSEITTESTLHLELNQILLRACDPRPEKRYQTARELRHELELLHAGKSIKRLRQVERRLRVVRLAFAASIAIVIAAFLVYQRINAKRQEAARERQRQAGSLLAQGTIEMRNGYLARALPFFLQAAELDPQDLRSHQLRVGSVLAQASTLAKVWKAVPRAEFSDDGGWLVAPQGRTVQILESTTGRVIESHPVDSDISLAKISPDRSRLGAAHGSALFIIRRENGEKSAKTFSQVIVDFAFSPIYPLVAVSFSDGSAIFYDPSNDTARAFPGNSPIKTLNFDRSGNRIVTCYGKVGHQGVAQIRDGTTGEVLGRSYELRYAYKAAFSPDERLVVISAWGAATPLHVASGELGGDVMESDDAMAHGAFSESGALFASASYDGTVRLWDVPSFNALRLNHILEHRSRPERVAFIGNDILVSRCTDGETYVWKLGENKIKPVSIPQEEKANPLKIERGEFFLSADQNQITGKVLNKKVDLIFPSKISALAVSPKGDAIAAGSKDSLFEITQARLYRLNALDNPIDLHHRDGINYLTFSNAGDKLVTCSEDFSAILWDAKTGKQIGKSMRHRWQVVWADFSSDDRWIATVGWDDSCIIWDAQTGEPLTAPMKLPEPLEQVEFAPADDSLRIYARYNMYRLDLPLAELPLSRYADRFPSGVEYSREAR